MPDAKFVEARIRHNLYRNIAAVAIVDLVRCLILRSLLLRIVCGRSKNSSSTRSP